MYAIVNEAPRSKLFLRILNLDITSFISPYNRPGVLNNFNWKGLRSNFSVGG